MATSSVSKAKARDYYVFIIRTLFISLVGLCFAFGGTVVTSMIISNKTLFSSAVSANREANILFLVFVTLFLLSVLVSCLSLLKKKPATKNVAKKSIIKTKKKPVSNAEYKQLVKDLDAKNLASNSEGKDIIKPIQRSTKNSAKFFENIARPNKITFEKKLNHKEIEKADASALSSPSEKTDASALSFPNENAFVLKYLSKAMAGSKRIKKKLDNFNKFGINLWLAGACESFALAQSISDDAKSDILAASVQIMGFKKSHSMAFSRKYEEYLLQDPRYMQMFQSGRNAMRYYLNDKSKITAHLDKALEEWNKPKEKEEAPKIITVLFTDIAGSTAITQKLGDAGAQELVRAHNKIVREALHQFHGREIKHTGDGIMASFNQASDSIEAAIMMQRGSAAHNLANPRLPLRLKIGINSGEPIQEENDLFGTMVQLSARIVDKAQGDEILVSETVRGICAGKAYNFQSRGTFPMKGFSGPLNLYDVPWLTGQAA